jgi:hypothetical protein
VSTLASTNHPTSTEFDVVPHPIVGGVSDSVTTPGTLPLLHDRGGPFVPFVPEPIHAICFAPDSFEWQTSSLPAPDGFSALSLDPVPDPPARLVSHSDGLGECTSGLTPS